MSSDSSKSKPNSTVTTGKDTAQILKAVEHGDKLRELRDRVIRGAAADAGFSGWRFDHIRHLCHLEGLGENMAGCLFPEGLRDVLAHFADYADRQMLVDLHKADLSLLPIRQRIEKAVLIRYGFLENYREAEKNALAYWALPGHHAHAGRILWRTADRIWARAGDTSQDYNRYTKRALLCPVLAATTLCWVRDTDFSSGPDQSVTARFLRSRLNEAVHLGSRAGRYAGPVLSGVINRINAYFAL